MLTQPRATRFPAERQPKAIAVQAIRDHFVDDPEPVDRVALVASVVGRTGLAASVVTRALVHLMIANEIGCEWGTPRVQPVASRTRSAGPSRMLTQPSS